MSFVNTRTSLGEQAAFDALIAHTLTELNEDGISILPSQCIYYQENLRSVNFPNVTSISASAFSNNPLLETIDIGKQCIIYDTPIENCQKLKALILRDTTGISTLNQAAGLSGTPISFGIAGIFVPRALLSDYLANGRWAAYANVIRAIEDMPITDFSTITHTWTQIKSMVDDESFFSSDYAIGDYKQFTYGEHTVLAEIVKIDSTNKYVDFVLKNYDETIKMRASGGMTAYSETLAKARLDQIYANELPSNLKAAITSISKTYYNYDGTTETVNAPLWLLNTKDVNLTGTYVKESEGEEYTAFSTSGKRVKRNQQTGKTGNWWLGSAYSSSYFVSVNSSGNGIGYNMTNSYGLVFGFRIKKSA